MKKTKDKSVKTFNITDYMMADLMFFLRPMKERQQEMMFWQNRLQATQNDIIKSLGVDPTKYSADWQQAYQTGKLVCTKIPEPVVEKADGQDTKK